MSDPTLGQFFSKMLRINNDRCIGIAPYPALQNAIHSEDRGDLHPLVDENRVSTRIADVKNCKNESDCSFDDELLVGFDNISKQLPSINEINTSIDANKLLIEKANGLIEELNM